jgi:hypothetical protein
MSSMRHGSSHLTISGRSLSIPGFDISWVGECPWNQGLCFGAEDGRLLITSFDGRYRSEDLGGRPVRSGEPVNGVAFSNMPHHRRILAISTRCDITWIEPEGPGGKEKPCLELNWGARGVYATTSGRFIAPLGPEGVLVTGPNLLDEQDWAILPSPKDSADDPITIYGIAPLIRDRRFDLFACAARQAGIVPLRVLPEGAELVRVGTSQILDIVDVCGMATNDHPYALVGLGADGSLHLLRDLLADGQIESLCINQSLGFHSIQGAAYSLRRAGDHLVLLTSEGVYVFQDFAQRIIDTPFRDDEAMEIYGFTVEAVGIFVVYDRLYLVLHDQTVEIPLSELIPGTSGTPLPRPHGLFTTPEPQALDRQLEWAPNPLQFQMTHVA